MSILISFLYLLLYIAIIIFVAFAIRWVLVTFIGIALDPNIDKWGRIIVGLLCLIAVVVWVAGVVGMGGGLPHPYFR